MNLHRLREMHAQGEKITMLTAYDATFARLVDEAGVDCILVGDSLGMIVQGHTSTVPVSLDEMVYHTRCVARGNQTAWVVSDLPFGSYQESREQALIADCQAQLQAAVLAYEAIGQQPAESAMDYVYAQWPAALADQRELLQARAARQLNGGRQHD